MIALLMAASAVASLTTCVSNSAAALGAGNQEPADAVIKAANGQCVEEWARVERELDVGALGAAASGPVIQRMFEQNRAIDRNRIERKVYAQAFAALMRARASDAR